MGAQYLALVDPPNWSVESSVRS